ncbi:MAG: ATP-binding cassette domain-containing protein, partial [Clostridia bacterium]|nr:ATP-binding cassette domain-containing protein [Clostridia bacterium]
MGARDESFRREYKMTTYEKISSNKAKLTFVVPAEDFEAAMNKAYLQNRGKINVPGFRKGKAPRNVIENMYGKFVFVEDALDIVFPEMYDAAIKENELKPVGRPEMTDMAEYNRGAEMSFTVEVFVRPDVTLGEYKGLTAEVEPKHVVEDEEIDEGKIEIKDIKGDLRFENVSFGYTTEGSDKLVISHLNLDIKAGKTLALVGPSGGGKSTLCHLIPRFYNVNEGRITLDGNDIRDITINSLRKNIGIVSQSVFLFDGTVRENIAYGTEATDEQVIAAAKSANIHDYVMTL